MSKPDHNTINRFCGKRLDGNLKEIFGSVVEMLAAEGYLSIKEVYIDGTKMQPETIMSITGNKHYLKLFNAAFCT